MDIVIYGAGKCGRDARRALEDAGERVLGFLDRSLSGEIDDAPCVHPESEEAQAWKRRGAHVMMGVWNPYAPLDEIEADLKAAGWANIENFPRLHARHFEALGDRFWLGDPAQYKKPKVQRATEKARGLWRDEKSRRLFDLWMQSRVDGDMAPLNQAWREESEAPYFARDIEGWPQAPSSFVDCGAYDGDTMRELHQLLKSGGHSAPLNYYGFEPDPANFARLSQQARQIEADASASSTWSGALWPCGVWNETTTLSFRADGLASSGVDDGGSLRVPVVALDDVLHGAGVEIEMLKMDIEGAEPQALLGARELIARTRPALAICLYHHATHAWEIPLLVDSWQLGYQFALRTYCCNGFESVLYAVPA